MTREAPHVMTAQDCLVALMVAITVSDEDIRTSELVKIQGAVNNLPIFAEYDQDRLNIMSQVVFDLFVFVLEIFEVGRDARLVQ